jgi:hypothetical protein
MIIVLRFVLFLLFIVSIYWPIVAFRQWQDRWRYIALIPLLFPAVLLIRIAVHLLSDPPVYELSAYEVLIVIVSSLITMWLITFFRRKRGHIINSKGNDEG